MIPYTVVCEEVAIGQQLAILKTTSALTRRFLLRATRHGGGTFQLITAGGVTDNDHLHALPKVTRGYDILQVQDGGQYLTGWSPRVGGADEPAYCRDKKRTLVALM